VDVVERLSLEEVRAGTLIASEHLHRYELAAELCGGLKVVDLCCGSGYGSQILREGGASAVLGVDNDEPTIDRTRKTVGNSKGVEFVVADAAEFLERDAAGWDAVVMFEGLEHLADPEPALRALERHCESGLKCVLSVPNSRALGEENPYHVTDYGYAEAMAAFERFGSDLIVLFQYAAEGSLIRAARPGGVEGRFVLTEHGEPEYCNHFIAVVNFGRPDVETARMGLEVAPVHRRYLLELERRNRKIWDEVVELSDRNRALTKEYERAADEAAHHLAALESIRSSVSWRITAPLRAAKRMLRGRRAPSSEG
jgi:SAM-dependent methyltransferase